MMAVELSHGIVFRSPTEEQQHFLKLAWLSKDDDTQMFYAKLAEDLETEVVRFLKLHPEPTIEQSF